MSLCGDVPEGHDNVEDAVKCILENMSAIRSPEKLSLI